MKKPNKEVLCCNRMTGATVWWEVEEARSTNSSMTNNFAAKAIQIIEYYLAFLAEYFYQHQMKTL